MRGMFIYCTRLKSLDLFNFDTSKVIDMSQMFYNCGNLTNLNCSSFDTSKVINMREMFHSCKKLVTLDLSSFVTTEFNKINLPFKKQDFHDLHDFIDHKIFDKIKDNIKNDNSFRTFLYGMFDYCPNLKNIITNDINIINIFNRKE